MFQNDDYTIRRPEDFDYDAAIAEAEEQVRRKKYLASRLAHFRNELTRLTRLEESRREELAMENADVERLRRVSPAVILYTLTGQKAAMLEREQAEALAAAARYETVKNQLDYAEGEVQNIQSELRRLGNCERKLEALMEEKKQRRMAQDAAFSQKTAELERTVREIDLTIAEIDQAIDKGERVRGIIRGICNQLGKAYNLTAVDVVFNRHAAGFLLDAEKHEHLDTAQAMLEKLGQYLQDFAAELEDVELDERDLPDAVNVGDGTRTLDLFFDNIFTDFAVRRRIAGSKEEMEALWERIEPIMEGLAAVKAARVEERTEAERALREFILTYE